MSDPLDTNDDWAELARELERDKPPAPADVHPQDAEAAPESAEAQGDEEFEDGEEVPAGEAGTEGDGTGTGRKRRRRRRRRRKPGETAAPVAGAPAAGERLTAAGASPLARPRDWTEIASGADRTPAAPELAEVAASPLEPAPAPVWPIVCANAW